MDRQNLIAYKPWTRIGRRPKDFIWLDLPGQDELLPKIPAQPAGPINRPDHSTPEKPFADFMGIPLHAADGPRKKTGVDGNLSRHLFQPAQATSQGSGQMPCGPV